MKRTDNYALQAKGAMDYFLRYDQEAIICKLKLKSDEDYLYTRMLCTPTGSTAIPEACSGRQRKAGWMPIPTVR